MHAEAQMDLEALRRSADSACRLMKVLSNPDRLLLLCQLTQGEKSGSKGNSFEAEAVISDRQRKMILAGGLLNYTKEQN